MKFLLTILTFLSIFTLNLSANHIKSNEVNNSEVSPNAVDEVVIENIDGKVLNEILIKYNPRFGPNPSPQDLDKQLNSVFSNFFNNNKEEIVQAAKRVETLMKNEGFKDVVFKQIEPTLKRVFKIIWDHLISILDSIWSATNQLSENLFKRRLPISYYTLAKSAAKQFGGVLCEKGLVYSLDESVEKAVNQCSTLMTSLDIQ